jgi:hypothetical protein
MSLEPPAAAPPEPLPPPPEDAAEESAADATIRAQVEDWLWLDDLRNTGQLEAYRGEILFVAGKQILSHSPHMGIGWALAEAEARARGIPFARLSHYLVPG